LQLHSGYLLSQFSLEPKSLVRLVAENGAFLISKSVDLCNFLISPSALDFFFGGVFFLAILFFLKYKCYFNHYNIGP